MNALRMDAAERLRRLRWQCRRGMLELDALLSRFLDLGYADLDDAEVERLTELLCEQDQQLHRWLVARSEAPEPRYLDLVERIRRVGGSRPREC